MQLGGGPPSQLQQPHQSRHNKTVHLVVRPSFRTKHEVNWERAFVHIQPLGSRDMPSQKIWCFGCTEVASSAFSAS